jgi:hypothetical protein
VLETAKQSWTMSVNSVFITDHHQPKIVHRALAALLDAYIVQLFV